MNKHNRDCLNLCREAGLRVIGSEPRGCHWAVVCEEGRMFFPKTPSDWRWRNNARSVARRLAAKGQGRA